MGVNVVKYGGKTILDLTDATADAASILYGYTAYGANGEKIVGTAHSTKRQEVSVTLPQSGWSDGQQSVSVSGMTADATVITGADLGSEPEYTDCGVYCSAQASSQLTFSCGYVPSEDLVANIVFFT